MFFMHSPKIIKNYENYQFFSNILIFTDLLLPVPCNSSDYYTEYGRFSSFFKTYNLFQSNWNFILYHMYNEISTKFQHFLSIPKMS
jgi:hypothetical protein